MSMTLEYLSKEIFAFFYEKVYKTPCPVGVYNSERALDCVEDFAKRIKSKYKKSAGPNYIYSYVLYQFGRYYDKIMAGKIGGPSGKITMLMVFGAKPHDVFENRRVEMDFMLERSPLVTELSASKVELKFKKGIQFEERREVYLGTRGTKDPIKAIAASGEKPLETCIDMTDLYDSRDGACIICADQVACKAKLKELYPNVYKRKGYE